MGSASSRSISTPSSESFSGSMPERNIQAPVSVWQSAEGLGKGIGGGSGSNRNPEKARNSVSLFRRIRSTHCDENGRNIFGDSGNARVGSPGRLSATPPGERPGGVGGG